MTTMKNPLIASDTEVTEGQIETSITLVTDATRKATGVALRELVKNGVLTKANIEKVRARGNEVVAAITALVKEKFAEIAETVTGFVKLISGAEVIKLDPTNGSETIAAAKALFGGYLDGDFINWGLNIKSGPTTEQVVQVHEMVKDGTFAQIFNGLSTDLKSLCLTQAQIINFVKKYRKWLRTDGYGTFFLFQDPRDEEKFFVARVYVYSDGNLRVRVDQFSHDYVWIADDRPRVVVPQLPLEN
jgi:hypothetical protein